MNKLQEFFEKHHKERWFRFCVLFFHGAFFFSIFWMSQKSIRTFLADGLFVGGVIVITFYWKLFAKMKKKEYEKL